MSVEITHADVGVALLISNNYAGSVNELEFTHRDSDGLRELFEKYLSYKVYQSKNVSKKQFISWCKRVAEYMYPETCKRIVVYFSGHGKKRAIQMQDGESVAIEDMISHFKPNIANNDSLAGMIKMFFIDACRGGEEEAAYPISKAAVAFSKCQTVSSEADIFVAYASPPSYKSYGFPHGSRWTTCLIEALQKSKVKDSLYDVITATNKMMSTASNGIFQTPEFTSRLTDMVYFKKEAVKRQKTIEQGVNRQQEERNLTLRGAEGFSALQRNDNSLDATLTDPLQGSYNYPYASDTRNLPRNPLLEGTRNPLLEGTISDLSWAPVGTSIASNRDVSNFNFLPQTPLLQGTSDNLSWLRGGSSSALQRGAFCDFTRQVAENKARERARFKDILDLNYEPSDELVEHVKQGQGLHTFQGQRMYNSSLTPNNGNPSNFQDNHSMQGISGTSGTLRSDLSTSMIGPGGDPINNMTNTEQFQHYRPLGIAPSPFHDPRFPQQRGGVGWLSRTYVPRGRYY